MTKLNQLSVLLLILPIMAIAQEPLKHEKKIYSTTDGKIFVNKTLPVYFRIAVSPAENAPSYVLPSVETAKYANPMYFDTEGRNTLRSPSAVDTTTKKVVLPKHEIIYEIYVDGLAPHTKIKLNTAGRYIKNGVSFFGKGVKFDFESNDENSGVEATYLSVNKSVYQDFAKSQKAFDDEKEYFVSYYSVDHVGNAEVPKSDTFGLDLTAPVTSFKIIGASKGNVLSSKASISFSSKDTLSGVKHIVYSINEGPEKAFSIPIPISILKDGKSKIHYYAIDNVGNKEEIKVLTASTEAIVEKIDHTYGSTFSFYIDKEAPVTSSDIIGDQYKGKFLYISERSRIKINATDEKSGVEKIIYSINNNLLKEKYSEPFAISNQGLNTVLYTSSDNVGNIAVPKAQQIFLDKSIPVSNSSFRGKQFADRDTIFITSDTHIAISTSETGSGIQAIEYSLDGGNKTVYTSAFKVEKDGYHTLEYHAKDNVNNVEEIKKCSFFIDNIAPKIYYHFSVKAIGEKTVRDENYVIYPSNAMLYIAATDNASGGEKIEYRINGKEVQTVTPVKGFAAGNYEIEIFAYDVLKNRSSQVIRFAIEN